MDELIILGYLGILLLLTLFALRIPVALAMIVTAVIGHFALAFFVPHFSIIAYLKTYKTLFWGIFSNYPLSALPLFIFMGSLAYRSNINSDLLNGFMMLFGRLRSGVAVSTIVACAGFGAVCGSSLATAATMSSIALKPLKKFNYPDHFATGLLAAGGTLGVLIPPSIVLVLYSIVVEVSIIDMFQAAIIPGIIAVLFFVVVCIIYGRRLPKKHKTYIVQDKNLVTRRFIPIILVFSIIILGLAFGIFTPTPAAAIGVLSVLTLGVFRQNENHLKLDYILLACLDTAKTTSLIALILFGAETLKSFFSRTGLPQSIAEWAVTSQVFSPIVILLLILLILIILGCALESLSLVLVVVPFFWPALVALNGGQYVLAQDAAFALDTYELKIWFGILALVVVELGLITPPLGLNVYVIHSFAKNIPLKTIFKGTIPFFIAEIIRIILLIALPSLTLFLPRLMM